MEKKKKQSPFECVIDGLGFCLLVTCAIGMTVIAGVLWGIMIFVEGTSFGLWWITISSMIGCFLSWNTAIELIEKSNDKQQKMRG